MNKEKRHTDKFGNTAYYVNNALHRDNAPAIIRADGTEEYWSSGYPIRDNAAQIITAFGNVEYSWMVNNKHLKTVITKHGEVEHYHGSFLHNSCVQGITKQNRTIVCSVE